MSDRINRITVVLEKDIRDDDCETILSAIKMIKGVISVKANVANSTDYMVEERAKHDLGQKILKVIYPNQ